MTIVFLTKTLQAAVGALRSCHSQLRVDVESFFGQWPMQRIERMELNVSIQATRKQSARRRVAIFLSPAILSFYAHFLLPSFEGLVLLLFF